MEKVRLQKYISMAGIASRRKSEEYILDGKVKVNGEVVRELGTKVSPDDEVEVNGNKIKLDNDNIYIILNKPCGCVTTSDDQFGRKTVLDYVDIKERVYPVGRLDYNTSGLLVLTNDGDLTYRITHPSFCYEKTYIVKVNSNLTENEVKKLEQGVLIDEYKTQPAKIKVIAYDDKSSKLRMTIKEGRNRQIRKMIESIGHNVVSLRRIGIGRINIGNLKEGEWRYLTDEETEYLRKSKK